MDLPRRFSGLFALAVGVSGHTIPIAWDIRKGEP